MGWSKVLYAGSTLALLVGLVIGALQAGVLGPSA